MINRLQFLQSVGSFPSVTPGRQIQFGRLALGYADNARGKSTLAALMRSLATGDAVLISERQRLGAANPPHVVIDCSGNPNPAVFQNGAWNRTMPEVIVFDDQFVTDNVCSGLTVENAHRQNLHEFILGVQGVNLSRTLQTKVDRIEEHNRALRQKGGAIPAAVMDGLSVEEFCALPVRVDIDAAITAAERTLAAATEREPIQQQPLFDELSLPEIDVEAIEALLGRDLPDLQAAAAERVRVHMAGVGPNSEAWIAEGTNWLGPERDGRICPFCAQDTANSPIIAHYEAFFSEEYRNLKRDIAAFQRNFRLAHDGDAEFERSVRTCAERRQFWMRFCDIQEILLDTVAITNAWREAREHISAAFDAKAAAPLERIALSVDARSAISRFEEKRQEVTTFSSSLVSANVRITNVKQGAAVGDVRALSAQVSRLKANKARHMSPTSDRCAEYLVEMAAKSQTETERANARAALDQYRVAVFPGYQSGVNSYLERFGASFRLVDVHPVNSRTGTSCAYNVLINNVPISVGGNAVAGRPSFRTTLSAGDRNTLALAFFFASLDADPSRASRVVVIDDPVSSLDDGRALTTVQHIRSLVPICAQVIVLSHSKPFLCRIWEYADSATRSAFQVARDQNGSTLEAWNVDLDSVTEHDRRHEKLRDFAQGRIRASSEIARCIRPTLEAFFRVSFPEYFPPGTLLGVFRGICDQRVGQANQILDAGDARELRDIVEFANRYHHDTNPAWENEAVNDGELLIFANRALAFARR